MNQQPDKIFRDKLHGYTKPVSPDAWKRVSENQRPGTGAYMWLKVAASVLLIAVSGILIFPYLTKDRAAVVAENRTKDNTSTPPAGPTREKNSPIGNELSPGDAEEKSPSTIPPVVKERKKSESKAAKKDPTRVKKSPAPAREEVIDKSDEQVEEIVGQEPAMNPGIAENQERNREGTLPTAEPEPADKNVTIVFSAEEVNRKYLTKKAVAEATPKDEEASTLKKLLDKAYDLKYNQNPLGDLRQKKNEILALNFRGDKQRNEN